MGRSCEICGKGHVMGNAVTIRGKAKYLGGVGTKVTGIARRKFKPNLQRVHVTVGHGTNTNLLVCTQCIRSGGVTKLVKRPPFKLSAAETCDQGRQLTFVPLGRCAMGLSREDVEKVALLGRLRLSPQEIDTMTAQLGAVVEYVQQLSELNTDDVRADGPCRRIDQRLPARRSSAEPRPQSRVGECSASRRRVLSGAGRAGRVRGRSEGRGARGRRTKTDVASASDRHGIVGSA